MPNRCGSCDRSRGPKEHDHDGKVSAVQHVRITRRWLFSKAKKANLFFFSSFFLFSLGRTVLLVLYCTERGLPDLPFFLAAHLVVRGTPLCGISGRRMTKIYCSHCQHVFSVGALRRFLDSIPSLLHRLMEVASINSTLCVNELFVTVVGSTFVHVRTSRFTSSSLICFFFLPHSLNCCRLSFRFGLLSV